MSEIDPWALPQGGAVTTGAGAGIPRTPGTAPRPIVHVKAPLSKALPIVVMVLAALYVAASTFTVFVTSSHISLLNQLQGAIAGGTLTDDQAAQLSSSDDNITAASSLAGVIYLATLAAIILWQVRLTKTFGSVGARRAVFRRAGYVYFRVVWMASLVLGLVMSTSDKQAITTVQDAINHGHLIMVYCAARAILGVVLIVFALRLKKISEEGVARLSGGAYL